MIDNLKQDRQQIKVYKLNKSFWELRKHKTPIEKIHFIVNEHKKKIQDFESLNEELPQLHYENIHYFIYFFNQNIGVSPWSIFLPKELTTGVSFHVQKPSFVLFASDKNQIFATVGGKGFNVIRRYIEEYFGLDILTRIGNPSKDNVHYIKTRGITGNIAGSTEFYRENQKLIDSMSFGKIYKEILFQFDHKTLKEVFNFYPSTSKFRILGLATSSFQIRIPVNFDELSMLIHSLITILRKREKFSISTFIPINDYSLIENSINIKLYKVIKERIDAKVTREDAEYFDYDICHPSRMQEFYECDTYKLYEKHGQSPFIETYDRLEIYPLTIKYIRENQNINSLKEIMSFIGGIRIKGFKGEERLTIAPFFKHINCEIEYDKKPIFLIDKQWYRVRGNFIKNLNFEFETLVNNNYLERKFLKKKWLNPKLNSEDWYISNYSKSKNTIIIHKTIVDGIELCDLLHFNKNTIYLIHIKRGFNAMIRELTNQVKISSRRLWNDLKGDDSNYLKEVYRKISKSGILNHTSIKKQSDFLKLFKKNIVVVLAFCNNKKTNIKVKDNPSTFTSNIAKYSIVQTIREMKGQEFTLKVYEFDKE